jgi:transcriptional regulator with XRE-family HTH domain
LSAEELRFRAEVATKFRDECESRGLSQAQAAAELGVTRAAFHQYVKGKTTPQAAILARACIRWNLKLQYRGQEFGGHAFATEGAAPGMTHHGGPGLQMALFDEPQRFENDRVIVVLKRSHATTLQVTIHMKKADLSPDRKARRVRAAAGN